MDIRQQLALLDGAIDALVPPEDVCVIAAQASLVSAPYIQFGGGDRAAEWIDSAWNRVGDTVTTEDHTRDGFTIRTWMVRTRRDPSLAVELVVCISTPSHVAAGGEVTPAVGKRAGETPDGGAASSPRPAVDTSGTSGHETVPIGDAS